MLKVLKYLILITTVSLGYSSNDIKENNLNINRKNDIINNNIQNIESIANDLNLNQATNVINNNINNSENVENNIQLLNKKKK